MVRRLLLAAVVLTLAGPVAAQPADDGIIVMQGRDPPPAPGPRVRLFISPMGEPFRGPDGFSAWLAGADADHNAAVTLAEFRADAERFFRALDANNDGFIDGFEMQAYEREQVPEIGGVSVEDARGGRRGLFGGGKRRGAAAPAQGGGGPKGAGRDGAARYSLLNIPSPVAQADEDWNGRISAIEWGHAATRRFAMLDKDNAGSLSHDGLRPPPSDPKKR
jgi:hypothetical protein